MRNVQQVRTRKTRAASGLLALLAACLRLGHAAAASSAWHEEEGGRIRLLAAGRPDADGRLRGALEIALKPGWKTYWRDPGTAGVPPSFDASASTNVSAAELRFPAPERHDDGYGAWAGYSASVTLPVVFSLPDPGKPVRIEADVFLGLCRDICVPVSARLSLDASVGATAEDEAVIELGFAALPAPATARFGVAVEEVDAGEVRLSAQIPEGVQAPPQLFLASENGFVFGAPAAEQTAEGWRFAVPLLDRPAPGKPAAAVFFTLEAGGAAVSGTLELR